MGTTLNKEQNPSDMAGDQETRPGPVEDGPMLEDVGTCGICGAAAYRHGQLLLCRAKPGHMANVDMGMWADLTHLPRSS